MGIQKLPRGIGIVLARAGSKGLLDKNIQPLLGMPLIFHTLRPLINNKDIDKIIVSTDGDNIKKIVKSAKLKKVEIFDRPINLAGDTATTKATLKDLYNSLPATLKSCEFFAYMQITEPVRPKGILERCIKAYRENDCDSAFAAFEMHKNFWTKSKTGLRKLTPDKEQELPRQIKQPVYREDTGICCITSPNVFAKGNRIGKKPVAVVYDHPAAFVDIHSESDLILAKKIFELEKKNVE